MFNFTLDRVVSLIRESPVVRARPKQNKKTPASKIRSVYVVGLGMKTRL